MDELAPLGDWWQLDDDGVHLDPLMLVDESTTEHDFMVTFVAVSPWW